LDGSGIHRHFQHMYHAFKIIAWLKGWHQWES